MVLSSTLAPLATIIGWSVLPSFLSRLLLKSVYSILPSCKPRTRDSAARHAKFSYVAVIAGYLVYTLVNAYHTVLFDEPNAYHVLGLKVVRQADMQGEPWDANLKGHWRALARAFHPDKSDGSDEAEAHFVQLRLAYEVLSDPAKRAVSTRVLFHALCATADRPRPGS